MNSSTKVLLIEDDENNRFLVEQILGGAGFAVESFDNAERGLEGLSRNLPDILISDINLPGMDGFGVVDAVRNDPVLRYIPIILITAQTERDYLIRGFERGASDFLFKPFKKDELLARVQAALGTKQLYLEQQRLEKQNAALHRALGDRTHYAEILGQSRAMQRVYSLIEQVKDSSVSVLITGESGTGKELVARALHFMGNRAARPFVAQNCSALQEQLLESELFGHVRGAFTGAVRDREGLFETANGGTLFLDELGDMPMGLQAKLLRVLQDGTVVPVGSNKAKKVDVRVVAATNKPLERLIKEGKFREDLFYRINVVQIELPPLRDRSEDVPMLAEHFLAERARKEGRGVKQLSSSALARLSAHHWPGNVRELQNEISRAYLLSGDRSNVEAEDLLLSSDVGSRKGITAGQLPLKEALAALEKEIIQAALNEHGGNKSEAARRLGISRSNLISKVQEYGLVTDE
ncbi:MAG: sigma-54 dependent transcriptional regulator [Bdellovibrionota bacterium]|nr:MAG: sigma-54 dependent transcriptional regulator [Bdellovibrionota bacterium]